MRNVRERVLAWISGQLGRPHGLGALVIGRAMNRANSGPMLAAAAATELRPGETGADLGFGGGLGLAELLRIVGPGGHVVGVDASPAMLRAARRRHRRDLASGRLRLVRADLASLPLETSSLEEAAGFPDVREERVGEHDGAYHLLIARSPLAPSGMLDE